MNSVTRRKSFFADIDGAFDVAIVGGGVQGACLYHLLSRRGYRVLLVEQHDFGGGTSQASATLVWGGLLYLRNLDVMEVVRLSAARDRLLRDHAGRVRPRFWSYVFGERRSQSPWVLRGGLWVYWLLGGARRARPVHLRDFPERGFLKDQSAIECLRFEEGQMQVSDARFVYDWIALGDNQRSSAVNYCSLRGGGYDTEGRMWRLELHDELGGAQKEVRAKWVVNCAGVWADGVNQRFGIKLPYRHLLAKGVSFTFTRPSGHRDTIALDGKAADAGLSLVPWGPVSLWGSTETVVESPEQGWSASKDEVQFLLDELNAYLRRPIGFEDVVALRCGVRPLVAPHGRWTGDAMQLSKRWRVHRDKHVPWISVHGGKLTACCSVAGRVGDILARILGEAEAAGDDHERPSASLTLFAGLEVPSHRWCHEHEDCWKLDDYLRRRTNIAQWIPRGGLGAQDEHREPLRAIAVDLCGGDGERGDRMLLEYVAKVREEHDRVLGQGKETAI